MSDRVRCPIHNTTRACPCGGEVTEGNLPEVTAVAGWSCPAGDLTVGTPTIPTGGLAARCYWCHGPLTRQGVIFYASGRRVYPALPADGATSGDLFRYFVASQVGESER